MRLLRPARLAPLLASLLLAVAIPACTSDPPTVPTLPEGEIFPVTLYAASTSGITQSERRVVRQEADYETLWDDLFADGSTPTERPAIDFTQTIVLAVASGEQSQACFSIEITEASSDGTDLTVTVTETGPTSDCVCADMLVQPVEVVSVPRADEVTFLEATATACPAP